MKKIGGGSQDESSKSNEPRKTEKDLPFQLSDQSLPAHSFLKPPTGPLRTRARSRSRSPRHPVEHEDRTLQCGSSSSQALSPSKRTKTPEKIRASTAPCSPATSTESIPSSSSAAGMSTREKSVKGTFFPPIIYVPGGESESSKTVLDSSTWSSTYGSSTSPYDSDKSPSARTLSDVSSSIFDSPSTHSSSDSESSSGKSGSSKHSTRSLPPTGKRTSESKKRKPSPSHLKRSPKK